jgi:hypothetical protein
MLRSRDLSLNSGSKEEGSVESIEDLMKIHKNQVPLLELVNFYKKPAERAFLKHEESTDSSQMMEVSPLRMTQ